MHYMYTANIGSFGMNRCIEREQDNFKSREVKRLKECALALTYKYSKFTLRATQFNFTLLHENQKYSHMIENHMILRGVY